MRDIAAWGVFLAIDAGIAGCLWTLAREAQRHAAWHLAARRAARAPALEKLVLPPDFVIVPAQRFRTRPEPAVVRLHLAS